MFTRYLNLNGNSGVHSYNINGDSIDVIFEHNPKVYTYSYKSAGVRNVEILKQCALRGFGLNSYINRFCRELYVK